MTAEAYGKWYYGYKIDICNQGASSGVSRSNTRMYATEREAVVAACDFIKGYLLKNEFDHTGRRLWDKKLMCLLREVGHPKPVELELFQ